MFRAYDPTTCKAHLSRQTRRMAKEDVEDGHGTVVAVRVRVEADNEDGWRYAARLPSGEVLAEDWRKMGPPPGPEPHPSLRAKHKRGRHPTPTEQEVALAVDILREATERLGGASALEHALRAKQ